MTKFCLDEQRTEAWFDLEGGGRVCFQLPTADDLKAIQKQTVKKKVEYKKVEGKAERFEYEEVNEDLRNELFWNIAIKAWENLFDSKENPIECTRVNKMLLLTKSQSFLDFATDALAKLKEQEKEHTGQAEKNLQTG